MLCSHELPRILTSLHGREDELQRLRAAWDKGMRVVAVGGPPGIGKSRLVAEALATQPLPITWLDLYDEDHPGSIAAALEDALGATLPTDAPAVVVLNGADLVPAAISSWIDGARSRWPGVRWVVTARQHNVPDPAMRMTLTGLDVGQAAALFLSRARAWQPELGQSSEEQEAVKQLCRTFDGVPLALEHAAAYAPLLGLKGLKAELTSAVFDGTGSAWTGPPHHASLQEAVAWAWESLPPEVRQAGARWSLFEAPFSPEAAAAVGDLTEGRVAMAVDRLISAGLAQEMSGGRIRLLFMVAVYANRVLKRTGDARAARETHAVWHLVRAMDLGLRHGTGWCPEAAAETRRTWRDLRTALVHEATRVPHSVADALCALVPFRIGPFGSTLANDVAAALPRDQLTEVQRCRVACLRAEGNARAGRKAAATQELGDARDLASRLGDPSLLAEVEWREGRALHMLGQSAQAAVHLARAAQGAVPGWHPVGRIALDLGIVAAALETPIEAAEHFQTARQMAVDFADPLTEAAACYEEGMLLLKGGKPKDSEELLQRARDAFEQMNIEAWVGLAEAHLAAVAVEEGDWNAAWALYGKALERLDHEDVPAYRAGVHAAHGLARLLAGDLALASQAAALARVEAHRSGVPRAERSARVLAAACALESGLARLVQVALDGLATLDDVPSRAQAAEVAVIEAWGAGGPLPPSLSGAQQPTLRWLEVLAARSLRVGDSVRTTTFRVGPGACWFQLSNAERVDMRRRGPARHILAALVQERAKGSPHPLSHADLVAVGWPGQRLDAETARNRFHVTLSSMRKLGLDTVLLASADGYRLHPHLGLQLEGESGGQEDLAVTADSVPERPLLGREMELAWLADQIAQGTRLIAITGAVGMGKAHLLRTSAERPLGPPVVRADLANAVDSAGIRRAVGHALSLGDPSVPDPAKLARALREAGPRVLWLDTFERIREPLAEAVRAWLVAAPNLQIVTTGLSPLGNAEEKVLPLDPLNGPTAQHLFVRFAQQRMPYWAPDAEERARIAEVVAAVDGNPLAIRMIAARLDPTAKEPTPAGLNLLANTLDTVPSSKVRTSVDRTLAWSWSRLEDWQQRALAQLSVFSGGFDMVGARRVIDLTGAPPTVSPIQFLHAMHAHSWLQSMPDPSEPLARRFVLFGVVQRFLHARLTEFGEQEVQARFAAHTLEVCEALSREAFVSGAREVLLRLDGERDNLAAILAQARGRDPITAARAVLAQVELLQFVGPHDQKVPLVEQALEGAQGLPAPLHARLLDVRGDARRHMGDLSLALADLDEALSLIEDEPLPQLVGNLAASRAMILLDLNRVDEAAADTERALEAARTAGDVLLESIVLANRGWVTWQQGDLDGAARQHHEAVDAFRILGNRASEGLALQNLGVTQLALGELEPSTAHLVEARNCHHEVRNHRSEAGCESWIALLAFIGRQQAQAHEALERAAQAAAKAKLSAPIAQLLLVQAVVASTERRALARNELQQVAEGEVHGSLALAVATLFEAIEAGEPSDDAEVSRRMAAAEALNKPGSRRSLSIAAHALLGCARQRLHSPPAPGILMDIDARWIEVGGAARVDLSRRGPARRMLVELVKARLERPGEPLDAWTLIGAGWPGDSPNYEAARNRLYVTLNSLRIAGLRDVLVTESEGWLLNPSIPCRFEGTH